MAPVYSLFLMFLISLFNPTGLLSCLTSRPFFSTIPASNGDENVNIGARHQKELFMNRIRVGMIGAGMIADSHCAGINQHPHAKVVAIADLSAERRKAVKDKYALEKDFEKWSDLVADPDIDAVSIALPNALHAPVLRPRSRAASTSCSTSLLRSTAPRQPGSSRPPKKRARYSCSA